MSLRLCCIYGLNYVNIIILFASLLPRFHKQINRVERILGQWRIITVVHTFRRSTAGYGRANWVRLSDSESANCYSVEPSPLFKKESASRKRSLAKGLVVTHTHPTGAGDQTGAGSAQHYTHGTTNHKLTSKRGNHTRTHLMMHTRLHTHTHAYTQLINTLQVYIHTICYVHLIAA